MDYAKYRKNELKKLINNYYFYRTKKYVDFDNPKTFNEKIQWMKIII